MLSPDIVDWILIALILLLALKGTLNGFIREATQLIGIVGGVAVASRSASFLTHWLQQKSLLLGGPALTQLLCFLVVLLLIWGAVVLLGRGLSSTVSLPRIVDATLGYVTALIKYFLILSIIVAAFSQTKLFREKFAAQRTHSKLYPLLVTTGKAVMVLPPAEPLKLRKRQNHEKTH